MNLRRDEHVLRGGNSGTDVIRVGNTVRRKANPWSSSVDALLHHLESVGYVGAPRALGYDELGRQVLSFIPGRTIADSNDLDESKIRHVGRLIREFHDAMITFVPPRDAVWNVAITPNAVELICHNDLAPWNLVRGASSTVFIDWDGAGPGSRLWDLTYAAHGFVPISARSPHDDRALGRRLRSLVDGYGLKEEERPPFIELLAPRIHSMYELLRQSQMNHVEPWKQLWIDGHGTTWLEDTVFAMQRTNWWAEVLT